MANEDVVIRVRMELMAAQQQLRGFQKDVVKLGGTSSEAFRLTAKAQQDVYMQTQKLNKALGNNKFQGWAMSIMFAGMAIKQAMTSIWQSSSKTFNDVMHSVEGNVTAFDRLNGSIIYLGFTVGEALEPIADLLVPIVDAISDWVSKNPELVAFGFALTTIVGTLAFIGGSLVLAANGVMEFATKLGLAKVNAEGIFKMDWAKLGSMISTAVGTIAIGWGVYQVQDAFKSFEDGKWVDALLQAASGALMMMGGIQMLKGGAAKGGALFALGIAFELLDSNKFFETFGYLFNWLYAAFAVFFARIQWSWNQTWKNMLVDALAILAESSIVGTILSLAGYDVGAEIRASLAPDMGTFDWKGEFSKYFQESQQNMKNLDAGFKTFKDEIQGKAVPTTGNVMYGPENPMMSAQYHINQFTVYTTESSPKDVWNNALKQVNVYSGG